MIIIYKPTNSTKPSGKHSLSHSLEFSIGGNSKRPILVYADKDNKKKEELTVYTETWWIQVFLVVLFTIRLFWCTKTPKTFEWQKKRRDADQKFEFHWLGSVQFWMLAGLCSPAMWSGYRLYISFLCVFRSNTVFVWIWMGRVFPLLPELHSPP